MASRKKEEAFAKSLVRKVPGQGEEPVSRIMPGFKGASARLTEQHSKVIHSDKPLMAMDVRKAEKAKLSRKQRRALRGSAIQEYDEDWYYFLLRKFMLQERTPKTMQAMKNELNKYVQKFDTSMLSGKEVYEMMCKTVTRAMWVPKEEMEMRQSFKDEAMLEEQSKHQKFVQDGMAGHTWNLFSKSKYVMPTSK